MESYLRDSPGLRSINDLSVASRGLSGQRWAFVARSQVFVALLAAGGSSQWGDSRVSPSSLGTLHRHPEGKKSRLRAFSPAAISEPNGHAKNGLGPATSGVSLPVRLRRYPKNRWLRGRLSERQEVSEKTRLRKTTPEIFTRPERRERLFGCLDIFVSGGCPLRASPALPIAGARLSKRIVRGVRPWVRRGAKFRFLAPPALCEKSVNPKQHHERQRQQVDPVLHGQDFRGERKVESAANGDDIDQPVQLIPSPAQAADRTRVGCHG